MKTLPDLRIRRIRTTPTMQPQAKELR
jgi:hypothetical protein